MWIYNKIKRIQKQDRGLDEVHKGVKNLKWTYHGKLNYIDYSGPIIKNQVGILQENLNKQWNCGLVVDNKFGPKTSAACSKHNLYKGIKAEIMVKWLQHRLNELGYKLAEDGHFGSDTKKKVEQFQKSRHLGIDGQVGKATYKALTEWKKKKYIIL